VHTHRVDKSGLRPPQLKQFSDSQKLPKTSDKITKDVLKAAAGNTWYATEVMTLLLQQRGSEVKITEEVLKAAAGNMRDRGEQTALAHQLEGEPKTSQRPFSKPARLFRANAIAHRLDRKEKAKLELHRR
jgi:hypothetical protein